MQFARPNEADVIGKALGDLLEHCTRLGLRVTAQHVVSYMLELSGSPDATKSLMKGVFSVKGSLDRDRAAYHLETIYATLVAELGSLKCMAIPKERAQYLDSQWLKKSSLVDKFPTSARELERAGNSYAKGEPTACVFHAMRALEPALAALASPFGISTAHENWHNIIQQIEANIRKLGDQPKTEQKIDDETFFGKAASYLYFVKNAWRNHVAHARESYSDGEANKVLERTREFIDSLCPKLGEASMISRSELVQ